MIRDTKSLRRSLEPNEIRRAVIVIAFLLLLVSHLTEIIVIRFNRGAAAFVSDANCLMLVVLTIAGGWFFFQRALYLRVLALIACMAVPTYKAYLETLPYLGTGTCFEMWYEALSLPGIIGIAACFDSGKSGLHLTLPVLLVLLHDFISETKVSLWFLHPQMSYIFRTAALLICILFAMIALVRKFRWSNWIAAFSLYGIAVYSEIAVLGVLRTEGVSLIDWFMIWLHVLIVPSVCVGMLYLNSLVLTRKQIP